MTLFFETISPVLSAEPAFSKAIDKLAQGEDVTLAAPGLIRPVLTAAAATGRERPVLVVLPGDAAADRFARQLGTYVAHERVLHFTDRSDAPWERTAPELEAVGARARALYSLDKGRPVIVVASGRSLLRALPPQGSHVYEPVCLAAGDTLDLAAIAEQLGPVAILVNAAGMGLFVFIVRNEARERETAAQKERMEGELAATLQQHLEKIAHIQLADNPGRNEPGTGEINYAFLFRHLDRIGYAGWIGCEYKPAGHTTEGLGWIKALMP